MFIKIHPVTKFDSAETVHMQAKLSQIITFPRQPFGPEHAIREFPRKNAKLA